MPGWSNPPQECCGNWTPDGKYFIFQSDHDGKTQIWAMPEKGRLVPQNRPEPTQLTTGPLSYSPPFPVVDGKRIFAVGSQPRGELVRFNKKTQQFEPYLSGISADSVDFSRDGQWVAYVTYPEGNLWRSKADGSERLQLTFAPMQVLLPRWSPDQKQIVFTGFVPGKPGRNYMVSANGGVPQPVLPEEQTTMRKTPTGLRMATRSSSGLMERSIFWICEPTKYRSSRDQRDSSHLTGHPTVATSWRCQAIIKN